MKSGEPLHKGLLAGGLLAGFAIGAALFGTLAGLFAYVRVKTVSAEVRRGWSLMPIVVAAEDLHPGDKVSFDQISQRSIPEQLITSSIIKPDSASYIINQPISVPVKAGDPMNWSYFAFTVPGHVEASDPPVREACEEALAGVPDPSLSETTAEAIRARIVGAGR